MRFIIQKPELESMLAAVSLTLGRRIKNILGCVRITAGADKTLKVYTTRLSACMTASTAAVEVEAPGVAVVDAGMLLDVIRKSGGDHLLIRTDGPHLIIETGTGRVKLYVLGNADDLPPAMEPEGQKVTTKAAALLRTLNRVSFAVGMEGARYSMSGVAILPGSPARLVATDGRRMVIDALDFEFKAAGTFVIPRDELKAVAAVLSAPVDEVAELWIDERSVSIKCCDRLFSTNLIEGMFPPVDDVVPRDQSIKGNVGVSGLLSCLDSVSLFAVGPNSKGVRFALSKRSIAISATSPEHGDGLAEMTCGIDGEILIGFNPIFAAEYLRRCDSDFVDVGMNAPNRPITFRDEKRVCVLMPVNLQ